MQFDSLAAALAMDGHGAYVWFVALVTFAVIAGLLLLPSLSSRRFLREQDGILRREQRAAQQQHTEVSHASSS
ncbi:MAG: heme exporter protein CcmD [Halieaceae bacterium]